MRASVYIDGTFRHLAGYWEGRDIDPDSGIHEISKAIASLFVLRDAMMNGMCIDDRPPRSAPNWLQDINAMASEIIDRHPTPLVPYTEADRQAGAAVANGASSTGVVQPRDLAPGEMLAEAPLYYCHTLASGVQLVSIHRDVTDALQALAEDQGLLKSPPVESVRWGLHK